MSHKCSIMSVITNFHSKHPFLHSPNLPTFPNLSIICHDSSKASLWHPMTLYQGPPMTLLWHPKVTHPWNPQGTPMTPPRPLCDPPWYLHGTPKAPYLTSKAPEGPHFPSKAPHGTKKTPKAPYATSEALLWNLQETSKAPMAPSSHPHGTRQEKST